MAPLRTKSLTETGASRGPPGLKVVVPVPGGRRVAGRTRQTVVVDAVVAEPREVPLLRVLDDVGPPVSSILPVRRREGSGTGDSEGRGKGDDRCGCTGRLGSLPG